MRQADKPQSARQIPNTGAALAGGDFGIIYGAREALALAIVRGSILNLSLMGEVERSEGEGISCL